MFAPAHIVLVGDVIVMVGVNGADTMTMIAFEVSKTGEAHVALEVSTQVIVWF